APPPRPSPAGAVVGAITDRDHRPQQPLWERSPTATCQEHHMTDETTADQPEPQPRAPSWLPAFDWKGAVILILGVVALTIAHYHPDPLGLDQRYRLFSWHALNFLLLFVVPVLVIKFVFREPLGDYGLQLGDWRTWGKWLLLFLVVFIPCAAIASRLPDFAHYYPRYRAMLFDHRLVFASMAGWLVYFCAWEFFFRGFLLFGLGKRIGALAIFVQMLPFVMAHFPKPELESWAAVIAGVALGLMAWRGKSFVGTWLLHWLAATAMDLFVVFWPLLPPR
ncbi:CPBP family intramembrane metalloprotease, partial [bacterium]|nr:CPBP family intramembrane metalloprotease [bacterium]